MFREVLAVTRLNLSNLPSRLGGSTIIVVGIGGVVAVLLGLLAMSQGFRLSLVEVAKPDRALISRSGSNSEMDGFVSNDEIAALESHESLAIVSPEIVATISTYLTDGTAAEVSARGVTAEAFALRPELAIVSGRAFQPGKGEIIVGVSAANRYAGLAIGDETEARNRVWRVVGYFAAGGTAVESEAWMDLPMAQDAFRRLGGSSVVRARLEDGASMAEVAGLIEADKRLNLALTPESEFFARQSESRVVLINTFAYFIAGIMALGSVIAALNTMYTAVSRRTVEIATLRALGFGSAGVVVSVIVESMLLALAGGLVGAALVYVVFDGYAASLFNNDTAAQTSFAFRVTPDLVVMGLSWALALGLVGGLLPAVRAARLPITRALRGE